ncbi:MAG: FAD:protein FMN transferase [Peptoniphilaceae bacterium]|nr:FAD:protein FMN transferase [Peptoniphilaceae bacterium]MDY6019506.1 FAD:protein FMN transferase [Anaerococcus sp.]
MKKTLLIILSLSLVLTACKNEKTNKEENIISPDSMDNQSQVTHTKEGDAEKFQVTIYDYFDTVTTFTAYNNSQEEFEKYKNIVEKEMGYYHKLFNSYDSFEGVNNFYTINQKAGKEPVKVDKAVIDLIKVGQKWYKETDGKINIGAGSLLGIWNKFRDDANANPEKAKLPSKTELEKASQNMDINAIEVNEKDSTVYINKKDVQIDIGAIGKGYATELIKQDLIKAGLKNGILSVGGDVAIIGDNPTRDKKKFAIAVQDPDLSKEDFSSVVYVTNTSVVTSGDYQRYFEINGRKYHHIIDIDTLEPSTKYKSVTVIMDDIGQADALSTALFVEDRDKGEELAKKYKAQVFWIATDGKEYKTPGYEKLEKK